MANIVQIILDFINQGKAEFDSFNKQIKESDANTKSFIEQARDAGQAISSWISIGREIVNMADAVYDFARSGAELELVEFRFDRLSTSVGTTSALLLEDLRDATRGLYSDAELMASASDLMALGLAKNHDEVVRLASVSAGLNMDMNQLVLTLTNMTTMRFDALGVSVDGFEEKVKSLEEAGYSADAAFREAFLQQAEAQLDKVGHAADNNIGAFMRLEAHFKNIGESARKDLAESLGPAIDKWADSAERATARQEILNEVTGLSFEQYKRAASSNEEWADQVERTIWQLERGAAMTEFYSGMVGENTITMTENAEATAEAAEAQSKYYESVLSGAEKSYTATQSFLETQEDLKTKQAEIRQEIDLLISQGWAPYSEKVQDLEAKYDEFGVKIDETAEKHRQRLGEMQYDLLLTNLSADGLTTAEYEIATAAGFAFGVYDEEAMNAQLAQLELTKAVADGRLGVKEYGDAMKIAMQDGIVTAQELQSVLDSIPSSKDIDINVRTNFDSQYGFAAFNQGELDLIGRASGGPVNAGKMYEVNEQGVPELLDFGGRQFLMMPTGGDGYVTPLSGGAGGGGTASGSVVVQIIVQSPITIMDEEKATQTIIPLVEQAVLELQARGSIVGAS